MDTLAHMDGGRMDRRVQTTTKPVRPYVSNDNAQ